MICPKMEVPDAKAAGWTYDVVGHDDQEDAFEVLANKAAQSVSAIQTLAIEKSHLTVERLDTLQRFYPNSSVVGIDQVLTDLRIVKSADEVEKFVKQQNLLTMRFK